MRHLKTTAAALVLAGFMCCAPPDAIGDTGAATLAALSAMRTKSLPGASGLTWVASVGDYFRLQSGTTLTTDGITIINASDGTHQWVRTMTPNPAWCSHQAFWSLSPATGSDEAAGWGTTMSAADAHPLASLGEFVRRMKGCRISGILVTHVLDDVTENVRIEGMFPTSTVSVDTGQEGTLLFLGKPTVLCSGTLTDVVAQSGNTRGTVTDSSIPTSWTASGCMGTLGRGAAIRKTDLSKHAWILTDAGSKTIQIATPTDTAFETVDQQTSSVRADFSVNDAYEVVQYAKLGTVRVAEDIYVRLQGLTVGGVDGASTAVHPGTQTGILGTGVWFGYAAMLGPGPLGCLNCGFANTGMTNMGGALSNCTFMNDRTGGTVFNSTWWNVNGITTAYKMGYLWFKGSGSGLSYIETGNDVEIALWDCSDEAIYLDFGARLRLDKVMGAGNLGAIVSLAAEGVTVSAVSSHFGAGWTATGSGKPVKFSNSATYDYSELPVRDDALGKAVYGLQ